jgi:glycerol kinase
MAPMDVSPEFVLAVDVGSTSSRAILCDRRGGFIASASRPLDTIHPKPAWVEHDALDLWEGVREAVREVGAQADGAIAAVGLTNQRETFVLWERETGKPIGPAISWQCRRTADRCALLDRKAGTRIRRLTGLPVDPYFSASKLEWALDNFPGARAAAAKGRLAFGTVDTWLLWQLTGGRVHATEPGNASRTMLMDLRSLAWSPELLKLFRVPASLLPEIRDSTGASLGTHGGPATRATPTRVRAPAARGRSGGPPTGFGETDPAVTGFRAPILAMLGDQQASLYSQGGWDKAMVVNTYGTGMVAIRSTGDTLPRAGALVTCAAWRAYGKTMYCQEGPAFIAGAALQWLREALGLLPGPDASQALALSLPSNEGVYFVPAFSGLGTPHWDSEARGLLIGLTRGTGPAHFARAALESIAYQVRDILSAMPSFPKRLRACGGVAANDFLMQFQADILGIPVERSANLEATALGAAALAGVAAGLWTREAFAAAQKIATTFQPAMAEKEREGLYRKWRQAVERSRGWARG